MKKNYLYYIGLAKILFFFLNLKSDSLVKFITTSPNFTELEIRLGCIVETLEYLSPDQLYEICQFCLKVEQSLLSNDYLDQFDILSKRMRPLLEVQLNMGSRVQLDDDCQRKKEAMFYGALSKTYVSLAKEQCILKNYYLVYHYYSLAAQAYLKNSKVKSFNKCDTIASFYQRLHLNNGLVVIPNIEEVESVGSSDDEHSA